MCNNEIIVEEEEYKGYTIKIIPDDLDCDPRKEYDNAGTMVCWHDRYNLGDEQPTMTPREWLQDKLGIDYLDYESKRFQFLDEASMEELVTEFAKTHIVLPLFTYEHGGITMRTKRFSDPWDTSAVGWIYISRKDAVKEWGKKLFTAEVRRRATNYLEGEVETYDRYLTGQVYGFVIEDEDGDEIDSCWGFFDEPREVLKEAKGIVDSVVNEALTVQWEALERVPVLAE